MFANNAKTYTIIPSIQVIDEAFIIGHVVECYEGNKGKVSQYFREGPKAVIIEQIKEVNGFKTKAEKIIETLLGSTTEDTIEDII